jgi:hypothetical protein
MWKQGFTRPAAKGETGSFLSYHHPNKKRRTRRLRRSFLPIGKDQFAEASSFGRRKVQSVPPWFR